MVGKFLGIVGHVILTIAMAVFMVMVIHANIAGAPIDNNIVVVVVFTCLALGKVFSWLIKER